MRRCREARAREACPPRKVQRTFPWHASSEGSHPGYTHACSSASGAAVVSCFSSERGHSADWELGGRM